ncbi:hypothetical protein K504DRAFT_457409 [Pleomassaria siparia CBS 279.74]|uniref:Cora-domain-containing protein n=1 Tax=Pleomassaria siparia CBS 279.74 TaxID=1314801 RepID=A0A6G1KQX6_9PLEO|nr:hypothetical protein K504DRAFT_457409 [Pleomassaria siparia CBS 279.74]
MGLFAASKQFINKQSSSSTTSSKDGRDHESENYTDAHSRLEATLLKEKVEQRPISRDGQVAMRHAEATDLEVNELDHDYDINVDQYPYAMLDSAQGLFDGVLYHKHLNKPDNFGKETNVECFSVEGSHVEWLNLDGPALRTLVKESSNRCNNVSALSTTGTELASGTSSRKALVFFIPLLPTKGASFNYGISLTSSSVDHLYTSLSLNPSFILNMLGRPDYWAPQLRWDQEGSDFLGFDFYCQHPRWNILHQGAPLSVYSKHDVQRDLTLYIISHNQNDTIVRALRALLTNTTRHRHQEHTANILLESPLDLHAIISNLNFEASKWHVERFRRFQWQVINKVDDHLAGLEASDGSKLKELTKKLQIVSQSADSHIANAEVFLCTAKAIQDVARRSSDQAGNRSRVRQRTADAIQYAVQSMEKQRRWFKSYKARKDSTMNLVYNLVTQQDALNNLGLAAEMKKDSTSMISIAIVTMVFLPGTFTASVFSAGIFEQDESQGLTDFSVTGLMWLWVVITVPITGITMLCYWWYKRRIDKKTPVLGLRAEQED